MLPATGKDCLLACTAEHLVPRSLGGNHHIDNLVAAHFICNQQRDTSDWLEYFKKVNPFYKKVVIQ